ncbi:MAG TPA: adenylyltransferase/cytidyltransferase family protein [Alphaproteobacteria bacterium]|nr:adenylyltransferase/cytidyltransferase family protein [Alphaproteobacteria bacterium]
MATVITFGTFDLFHIGHLRLLRRARALGDRLVVGVSTDALNIAKKGFAPIFSQADRMDIVAAVKGVDEVFSEDSLERKGAYIKAYKAGILVMGDDWRGKFDQFGNLCQVVYLPRTEGISTTQVKEETVRKALS